MKRRFSSYMVLIVAVLGALALGEVIVRFAGYSPGDLRPNWLNFKPVDTLLVQNYFYTNNMGILVADSSFWANKEVGINEDGFRSPSFHKLDTSKKRVMFIGDSFTWGKSAEPLTGHCFVDLLRNETNYEVINLGIPGADPVQYYELASAYLPVLKPDVVLVMFYMGNDLMVTDRKVVPGRAFCYATNAGMIFADMDGRFFASAQQAYDYINRDKYYLRKPANFWEWMIAKSALLSRLYALRFRVEEKLDYERTVKNSSVSVKYLAEILDLCKRDNVEVRFVLIPEVKEADMDSVSYRKRYDNLLNNKELRDYWMILKTNKTWFRSYPDGHLNNEGHRRYADFLKLNLPQLLSGNQPGNIGR